jgi:hypothetical protein
VLGLLDLVEMVEAGFPHAATARRSSRSSWNPMSS